VVEKFLADMDRSSKEVEQGLRAFFGKT
jgi:hypothetical protein